MDYEHQEWLNDELERKKLQKKKAPLEPAAPIDDDYEKRRREDHDREAKRRAQIVDTKMTKLSLELLVRTCANQSS
jgi:hypothetical protein